MFPLPRSVCSMAQTFTFGLIQTSDFVIERGPLKGLNLYNTETERGTERERTLKGTFSALLHHHFMKACLP